MRLRTASLCLAVLLPACSSAIHAQSPNPVPAPQFTSLAPIAFNNSGPVLRAHTEALKPFTVAGQRGVILGQQGGAFEAWVLPVKLLSHLTIEADIEGYTVPIDVNQQSAEIEVRPDRTVITYAHIGFTVRQIMFSPSDPVPGAQSLTGPVVLFEFDCLHPTDFTLRFTPALEYMWPERNEGHPSPEWVAPGPNAYDRAGGTGAPNDRSSSLGSGYYVLHADYPDLAAALAIPGARPGILAPYQERPQVHPVEFKLHIDPARDRGRLYPLLMAVGTNKDAANSRTLGDTLEKLNQSIVATYAAHAESYKKLLADSVSIETPDKSLNQAFQWAVVSIEQLKAKPVGTDETALVAGYYASGDSARPGFGWFFGRDALYTLYAVNGYGDFGLARSELEFLIHRQRSDGKIMHEYSQTASQIDWRQFPYMYAAADSTPLFLMATLDYVRASGDIDFLKANRDAVEKAWTFETGHADTNGIYDNRQGTGWVESWPGGMPHQEIYLALLDQQASAAMAQIEDLLHDKDKSDAARRRAATIAQTINAQFYDAGKGCYAFSRNADGSLDRTTTVYPALAWWSDLPGTSEANGARSILAHPEGCLQQLAAPTLNTDWGLRDVSNEEKIYDGMSYHQGSVWPLFTGWAAIAEYRGNQPLAGYQMLMENANLTHAQDLGAVTELLSGDFFVPFGRSTSHQLWSSAMVITPILRGLFGISIDAQTKTITVNPHLPPAWDTATVTGVTVGQDKVDLVFNQSGSATTVTLRDPANTGVKLRSTGEGAREHGDGTITLARPLVQIAPFFQKLLPGDRTHFVRVTHENYSPGKLVLTIEAPAGSEAQLPIFVHEPGLKLKVDNGTLTGSTPRKGPHETADSQVLSAHFPEGSGWKTITVTLTW
jgi:glycogen debranching enzyme